jgi:hypothetical protein
VNFARISESCEGRYTSDPKPVIGCNKRHYPEPEELQKNCRLCQNISSRSEVNGNTQNNKKKMKYQQQKGIGITSDGSGGTRHTGCQVLGKTEELGEFVYKIGCNDQADAFICTTEAIAEYVGVTYGWEMRMLVKNRFFEKVFTKPTMPTTEAKVTTRSQALAQRPKYQVVSAVRKWRTTRPSSIIITETHECTGKTRTRSLL